MNTLRTAALAMLFAGATSAHAACSLTVTELPVHMEGGRAISMLGINGTQIPVIVDSGAFFSTLTRATAEQLGLRLLPLPDSFTVEGLAGNMAHPRRALVRKVLLERTEMQNVEFLVGGNDSGLGAMGIMGRNILGAHDTEYDLAHGVIRLVKPSDDCDKDNMAYWAGNTPFSEVALLPSTFETSPMIRAKVKVNDHEVIALFDTGATTDVSLDAAQAAGLKEADLADASSTYGIGEGRVKSWTGRFDTIALGGETVNHNHLYVSDFHSRDFEMLVGIDFFLSHRVYVSSENRRMFFTYNGGPVFARNVSAKAVAATAPASQAADALTADELYRRGTASLARRDYALAMADLDRACALEPGNARFLLARAQAQARVGRSAKALADLDAALALEPKLDDARLLRASLAPHDGDHGRALQDLAILDGTLPPQSNMRWEMAHVYDELDSPSLAIRQWTLWIVNHRDDIRLPEAHNSRCWVRMEANVELAEAMADCNEAVGDEPGNAYFRNGRGWLQLRLDQPAKAKADFDVALKSDSRVFASASFGRGLARLRLGDTTAARADLAAARQADSDIDRKVKERGFEPVP